MRDTPSIPSINEPWISAAQRHGRLWRACFSLALVREAQFRAHFVTTVVIGLAQILLGIVPVLILFNFTDAVQGWTQADVIVVLGMQQAMMGTIGMLITHNMWAMMESVRNGDLDQMLIRPVNAQFYAATRWIRPDQAFNVLTGVVIIVVGLVNGRGLPDAVQWVQGGIIFLCGFVLLTCMYMAVSYCSFWTQSMESAAMVFNDVLAAGRYPVAFFPVAMRLILTFAIPLAFATTFPSEAITHGISWWWVVGAAVFAVLAIMALRWFWTVAVRQYSSASS